MIYGRVFFYILNVYVNMLKIILAFEVSLTFFSYSKIWKWFSYIVCYNFIFIYVIKLPRINVIWKRIFKCAAIYKAPDGIASP